MPDQEERRAQVAQKPYQFLLVSRLREYLALEFRVAAPFPVDVERVYDDFGARRRAPHSWSCGAFLSGAWLALAGEGTAHRGAACFKPAVPARHLHKKCNSWGETGRD